MRALKLLIFMALAPFIICITCKKGGSSGDSSTTSTSLNFTESASTSFSGVFGVVAYDGTELSVTYGDSSHLFARRFDLDLNPIGSAIQLTTNSDPEAAPGGTASVTDHKHIFTNSHHYITFSTVGDDDLYIMRYDTSWNRVGSIVTVVKDATDSKTNDMFMVADSSRIYVGRFYTAGAVGHKISFFNFDLTVAGSEVIANNPSHHNGASAIVKDSEIVLFTSGGSDPSGPHDLFRIHYDSSFNALSNSKLKETSDKNEFFPTGSVLHNSKSWIFVSYVLGGDGTVGIVSNGSLIIQAYNTSWSDIGSLTVEQSSANRGHLALVGDVLYLSYDVESSGFTVKVKKYTVSE